jgi:hypothetical protein
MATKRFKPLGKDELAAILEQQIKSSVNYNNSKLSKERQNVIDYYNAKLPKPQHEGNSKYVSMDVFDSVESLKAVLLETFAAGNDIVAFDPQGEDDVEQCREQTEYADYIIHRQNDSYKIFSEVIQDGLMARVGVAKVYWEECIEEVEEEFSNLTQDELDLLLAHDDIKEIRAEEGEVPGLYDGELVRTVSKSQVRVDPIAPNEFFITSTSKDIPSAPFVAHGTKKTFSDLLKEGYDPKKVAKITTEDGEALDKDPEVQARYSDVTDSTIGMDGEVQEQSRYVMVYECYLHLDMEGSGKTCLYKVTKAGNVILDTEKVDKKPFIHFCPIPMPHSFYGSNYAARVIPTQNARTVLVRGILDHTLITNNPRYMVVKGSVTNPKEMIENRIGGLVNVTRPDGILPFPQAGLNPFVFQTIQLLDEDKEEATGVSKLSQGLNKDAVSKQNSQGMVNDLVSLSQQREKIIARNFANQFIKPLYLEVIRLAMAHEKGEKIIEVAGQFKRIDPTVWAERTTCTVQLKLGYGEQEKEAQKLMGLHAMLSQDEAAKRMYTEQNRFQMYKDIFKSAGHKNIAAYLTSPDQLGPQKPDPMLLKKMELEERHVKTQEVIAKAQADKATTHAEVERMRVQIEQMSAQLEKMVKDRELDIREFDSTSKAAIAAEELQMAKETPAVDRTAIVSPNS